MGTIPRSGFSILTLKHQLTEYLKEEDIYAASD